MSHTITTRPFTGGERAALQGGWWRRRPLAVDVVLLVPLLLGCGTLGALVLLGGLLIGIIQGGLRLPATHPLGSAAFLGSALLGLAAGAWASRTLLRSRARHRREVADDRVEVIAVRDARLVQEEEYNDEGPLYYFGIGGGKVLFLGGQWTWSYELFGLPFPAEDAELAGDDAWPFPAASFTLHRLPLSGSVLRLDLEGERLHPEATLPLKAPVPAWLSDYRRSGACASSCLLEGDFEELLQAARAPTGRKGETT